MQYIGSMSDGSIHVLYTLCFELHLIVLRSRVVLRLGVPEEHGGPEVLRPAWNLSMQLVEWTHLVDRAIVSQSREAAD